MNLPENFLAAGRRAIELCWDDRADIVRNQPGVNVMETVEVCRDIPCHLSQSESAALEQTGTAARTVSVCKLFAAPDTDIRSGDTVTVRHRGKVFTGTAGEPFRRDFSVSVILRAVKAS